MTVSGHMTPRPLYPRQRILIFIEYWAEWAYVPVWTICENYFLTDLRISRCFNCHCPDTMTCDILPIITCHCPDTMTCDIPPIITCHCPDTMTCDNLPIITCHCPDTMTCDILPIITYHCPDTMTCDILPIITCNCPDTMTCDILPIITCHCPVTMTSFLFYSWQDTSTVQWPTYISTGQQDVCVGASERCVPPGVIRLAVWFNQNMGVYVKIQLLPHSKHV